MAADNKRPNLETGQRLRGLPLYTGSRGHPPGDHAGKKNKHGDERDFDAFSHGGTMGWWRPCRSPHPQHDNFFWAHDNVRRDNPVEHNPPAMTVSMCLPSRERSSEPHWTRREPSLDELLCDFHGVHLRNHSVPQRKVQPRRTKNDRKQTRRPTGIGCHASLGHRVLMLSS